MTAKTAAADLLYWHACSVSSMSCSQLVRPAVVVRLTWKPGLYLHDDHLHVRTLPVQKVLA